MNDPLATGTWFNRSRKVLLVTSVATAIGMILFCVATAYFVGQYFVCIGECRAVTPPVLLIIVSAFFGLIPAVGTGALGYFIAKGLWDDAHELEEQVPDPVWREGRSLRDSSG